MSRRSPSSQLIRMVFTYLALLLCALCALYLLGSLVMAAQRSSDHLALPFLSWLGYSSLVALVVAGTGVALASTVAYAFSRSRFLRRSGTLTGALIAQLLPAAILLALFCPVLFWMGLVNSYVALCILYVVTALPFSIWQLKGYYDTIPLSFEETAQIDSASPWQSFSRIILPLSLPAISITVLFSFLIAWNEYVIAAMLAPDSALFASPPGFAIFPTQMTAQWGAYPAAILFFLLLSRLLIAGSGFGNGESETKLLPSP